MRLPLLAGLLVGLGFFPGAYFLPFSLAGFLPLLLWLEANAEATAFRRLKGGLLFGVTVGLTCYHFMYSMLEQSWLAALLYLAMSLLLGMRIALSVALAGWLRRRTGLSWGLLLPIVWLPLEWAQTWGDLRMTGEHLAHTVAEHIFLVQFADLLGPYGVGASVLAINGLFFEAVRYAGRPEGRRALVAAATLAGAILAYGGWSWLRPEPGARKLRVALVQPNIPLDIKRTAGNVRIQWETLQRLTREAAAQDPDLIVWPESARPIPMHHDLARPESFAMREVQQLAREVGVPLLVGSEYARYTDPTEAKFYNAVFGVDAKGGMLEAWGAKVYLVPFVEATPFRSLLGPLVSGRGGEWHWLAGGFTQGPRNVIFDIAGADVGVLVCYEQLFPDLARGLRNAGAQLQVVVTNDAWFGRSLFQPYQANAARLRAIESRTGIVRVANTGVSGFVDTRGRYHRMTELFEETVEVWELPVTEQRTLYDRTGDVVAWLAIAGLLAATIAARRK
jgi:apolipoprotein N-acyltransferase